MCTSPLPLKIPTAIFVFASLTLMGCQNLVVYYLIVMELKIFVNRICGLFLSTVHFGLSSSSIQINSLELKFAVTFLFASLTVLVRCVVNIVIVPVVILYLHRFLTMFGDFLL